MAVRLDMDKIRGNEYRIEERIYKGKGIYVSYPIFVSIEGKERQDILNNIIQEDINKILSLYSGYAFTQPTKEEDLYKSDILFINYEIMRKDEHYLSILYKADFFSPYAAHPTQLIYTTNIDLKNNRRIQLSDIIEVNRYLVENFTLWRLVTKDSDKGKYLQAINDYIAGLGKEILWMGFKKVDIIGPDNYLEIFSYLRPDTIGISISVPNYLGDHVEFERAISK
jgi:hypothetical protein